VYKISTNYQKRIIVAISGASGAIYGVKILEILKNIGVETHLVISRSARLTISMELDLNIKEVIELADYHYNHSDIAAKISSGSFIVDGMIVAPCSMKTLAAIASGYEEDLISRAAGVVIKEQRKLVLMARETPLSPIHLENMLKLSRLGVVISPTVCSFYNKPKSIDEMAEYSAVRALDLFDFNIDSSNRWNGIESQK